MRCTIIYRVVCLMIWTRVCTVHSASNVEELSNEILTRFEKLLQKKNDVQVLQAMNILNITLQRFSEFQHQNNEVESRDAVNNARIGIFIFTRYCGPGARFLNRILGKDERTYADIDDCCREHDECPDFVTNFPEDYKNYPELDYRPQLFTRLKCSCDTEFYKCLENVDTTYAYSIGVGYGIFQRYCFEFEHPVIRCTEYYTGFGLRRCMTYEIDYDLPKRWQWFDVLPPYLEIQNFPQFIQNTFSLN